jgi:hypothetical protein
MSPLLPSLVLSALNFAQRAFLALEILALAAADIVRLRPTCFLPTIGAWFETAREPFIAMIAL